MRARINLNSGNLLRSPKLAHFRNAIIFSRDGIFGFSWITSRADSFRKFYNFKLVSKFLRKTSGSDAECIKSEYKKLAEENQKLNSEFQERDIENPYQFINVKVSKNSWKPVKDFYREFLDDFSAGMWFEIFSFWELLKFSLFLSLIKMCVFAGTATFQRRLHRCFISRYLCFPH